MQWADRMAFETLPRLALSKVGRGPWVYYVQVDALNYIKIGTTKRNLEQRLASLRTACPLGLRLVAIVDGGRAEEAALHRKFKACRLRGEWFRLSADLALHIDHVRRQNEAAKIIGWFEEPAAQGVAP